MNYFLSKALLVLVGLIMGITVSSYRPQTAETYKLCEFDVRSLRERVEKGWDINSQAVNGRGGYYPYVLHQIFRDKCLGDGQVFDRDLAYYYITHGGVLTIGSARKIHAVSIETGDQEMIAALSLEVQ